jgi:hypothetical protein
MMKGAVSAGYEGKLVGFSLFQGTIRDQWTNQVSSPLMVINQRSEMKTINHPIIMVHPEKNNIWYKLKSTFPVVLVTDCHMV